MEKDTYEQSPLILNGERKATTPWDHGIEDRGQINLGNIVRWLQLLLVTKVS